MFFVTLRWPNVLTNGSWAFENVSLGEGPLDAKSFGMNVTKDDRPFKWKEEQDPWIHG